MKHVLNALRHFGHIETLNDLLRHYELTRYAERLLESSSRWLNDRHCQASEAMDVDLRHPVNEILTS
ncbi:hypothetical protein QZM52_33665 [Burkholderia metallica]|uniref:Uncharacterized protein n=1 Tax=Burkholderia metallica TaxID=488729 RepID=A0ABT8PPC1_9BURK|nr:hypothetical protein [Burkholderia metallica]MDN7936228.1 hypothetical protein [Burkholderia metallica]